MYGQVFGEVAKTVAWLAAWFFVLLASTILLGAWMLWLYVPKVWAWLKPILHGLTA